ncbi:prolipoprotein diacylglyceryl transferase [Flavobacterium reichenbachii]|uniref:Phosphatidylglycerol--prolipoprotein diacylglyceryl transferase n=1 Tax=Flavobacterium reichenbachii TaxID=362418 RepID=A0A085ZQ96_9FLAO|nr:prolipoprotein diacylglyceryl transferase [Flavobacterium reichenbachii]KFF06610.1 prolipoprotein diacylglyceryl transferase [Flavobacterium reichenbachii]OXB18787.1 prolipoprotein diacylglyceryl transferase [Flavobacterium reichenbachii]
MTQLYINWDFDSEIISLFGIPLKFYGLLFATGLLLCMYVLKGIFKAENLSREAHEALLIYGVIGIFAGARLAHCFFYDFEYYSQNLLEIFLPIKKTLNGGYQFVGYAGLASHGGTVGLIIALYLYSKKYQIKYFKILDLIAVAAPLGAAFIRLANLMNSEMIGNPTTMPWAFVFKRIDNIPRHPAQLYEAISYFIIFAVILTIYKRKNIPLGNGFYFGLCIALIFTMRILIEFFKINQVDFEEGMLLNMGQILSIPFIIIGLYFVSINLKKQSSQNG